MSGLLFLLFRSFDLGRHHTPISSLIDATLTIPVRATKDPGLGEMAEDTKPKKNHMAIVLGIGLGVVLLIVLSLM